MMFNASSVFSAAMAFVSVFSALRNVRSHSPYSISTPLFRALSSATFLSIYVKGAVLTDSSSLSFPHAKSFSLQVVGFTPVLLPS